MSEACNAVTQVHASGEEWDQHGLFAEVAWPRVGPQSGKSQLLA